MSTIIQTDVTTATATARAVPPASAVSAAPVAPTAAPRPPGVLSRERMLHGPLLPLLVRLALPTVAVMLLTTLLAVAETYFVATLGTEAIAAASLVVPVVLLMGMVSNGGVGGGVSSAVARAVGAGRHDEAESLAWHAVVVGVGFGALFTLALLLGGRSLYAALGGRGATLEQAVVYSDILFAGAIASWVLMLLQAALRGAGNVRVPALVIAATVGVGLAISPALITGLWGFPRLGVAGAGVAQVVSSVLGVSLVVAYMRSARSNLRLAPHRIERAKLGAILRIGLPSSLNAAMSNVALTAVTAAAGRFGVEALAGYGIASRLDGLLVPVMFGFGTAVLTLVGQNLGAGQVARARRAAIVNALLVAGMLEALGLLLAFEPRLWLGWFTQSPEVLAAGSRYLRIVGPTYGFTAITLELYFAGQGARRIGWPMTATAVRCTASVAATLLVIHAGLGLGGAFALVAAGAAAGCAVTSWGFRRVRWGR
jgi:putative MATE family efflux protein